MATKKEIVAELEALDVEFDPKSTKADLLATLADATGDSPKATSSKVPLKYKKQYGKSQNCGDPVAIAFGAAVKGEKGRTDMEALYEVGTANGIDVRDRWGHLNEGMQRMNLGNVLRSRSKRGESVTIGTEVIVSEVEAA